MRRVLLRTAALGTVVVLGLIAIAQAQRGTTDAPPSAEELSAAASPSASRLDGNPLRSNTRLLEPISPSSSGSVVLTDFQTPAGTATSTAEAPPVHMPSADPFGFRANRTDAGLSPPPVAIAPAEIAPAQNIPAQSAYRDLGPLDYSPANASSAYTEDSYYDAPASNTLAAAGASAGQMAAPTASDPLYDNGYRNVYGGATASTSTGMATGGSMVNSSTVNSSMGEPAMFSADPYAAPADLSPPARDISEMRSPAGFSSSAATNMAMGGGIATGEGTGQPGGQQLEGPQSPQLTIEKSAPTTIQVGKSAKFRITVRNSGQATAQQVEIRDEVPKGARLIGTTPRASRGASGELVWNVGALRSGEETSVEMDLEPIVEGEIGSVATVRFQADASARCVVTKPQLVLKTTAPQQVLAGEQITLSIEISNPGSGTATGVVIEERVPAGLQHPAGPALEYEVGDLSPGESRTLDLTLVAQQPGPVVNLLSATAEGNLRAEDRLNLQVVSPSLEVAVAGPSRRYLDREATYRLSVHNPGTASAEQVELVAYLSDGLEFVSANNSGQYVEASRTVHWRLEELPTSAAGTVELVALPVEAGRQSIRLHGAADRGVSADGEHAVLVEGITALTSVVVDVDDPIEVGSETTYEVRVLNQGSKAATNVQLAVQLPPEMRPTSGEGPTRYAIDGNRVLFEGLPRLAPKDDVTYRVRAQGLRPGDLRVRVQLLADEMRSPVVKEESTRVYSDE